MDNDMEQQMLAEVEKAEQVLKDKLKLIADTKKELKGLRRAAFEKLRGYEFFTGKIKVRPKKEPSTKVKKAPMAM